MKYTLALLLLCVGCGNASEDIPTFSDPDESKESGYQALNKLTDSSAIDALICISGSGTLLETGLDTDEDLVLDQSEVTAIGVVCDGAAGAAGPAEPQGDPNDPDTIEHYEVRQIDPCGDYAFATDEILLRLANGTVLILDSNAVTPRMNLLTPGLYQTADGSACDYTIDANLILVDEDGNTFYPW